jgi:hypothetical protein
LAGRRRLADWLRTRLSPAEGRGRGIDDAQERLRIQAAR